MAKKTTCKAEECCGPTRNAVDPYDPYGVLNC